MNEVHLIEANLVPINEKGTLFRDQEEGVIFSLEESSQSGEKWLKQLNAPKSKN